MEGDLYAICSPRVLVGLEIDCSIPGIYLEIINTLLRFGTINRNIVMAAIAQNDSNQLEDAATCAPLRSLRTHVP